MKNMKLYTALIATVFIAIGCSKSDVSKGGRVLDVLAQTQGSQMTWVNTGDSEAVGDKFNIWINDTGEDGYVFEAIVPEVGAISKTSLNQFVRKKDGLRFDDSMYAVTTIWIGGGPKNYAKLQLYTK